MNETSDIQLMAERLESLKAGIVGGLSLCLAFVITSFVNNFLLARYFTTLSSLRINTVNLQFLLSAGIAGFSGLLFGVTYRYIIRCDQNPQLKAGGVLAFGLVRGLTLVDAGLNSGAILPCIVLGLESILWFVMAAIALDFAMQLSWIKPFQSS
ncbi:MAG: hypothetical protein ACHBN1_08265 [Heteroscytonema crispum UTEX LB 1556]